jgi:L-aminopeptidase/D-esterase-like protein
MRLDPGMTSQPDRTDEPVLPGVLPGVLVGHDTDPRRPTGVTVVLLDGATTVGVDVRGAAPGTRETDLLDPVNTVDVAHAIVLAGGSAYGLAAADGVMGWLEAQGRGLEVGPVRVPIVPAAVVFDLLVGDPAIRPDAASGARACAAAVPVEAAAMGSVGAGAGATVGKLLGPDRAMRGGVGIATIRARGWTMAAVVVVNALGDIADPATGTLLAGARIDADSPELADATRELLGASGARWTRPGMEPSQGGATTIGAIITDARLTKAQSRRLAQVGHDGLARTIRPVHTTMDGDTLFAAGTGTAGDRPADMLLLGTMAAEVTARAVLAAVRAASPGLRIGPWWLPAHAELLGS